MCVCIGFVLGTNRFVEIYRLKSLWDGRIESYVEIQMSKLEEKGCSEVGDYALDCSSDLISRTIMLKNLILPSDY